MHSTGSYIYTCLERIRAYLDAPDTNAKYTNDYIVRHILTPCMVDVLSRLRLTQDNLPHFYYDITLDKDVDHYVLPPNVARVLSGRTITTDEDFVADARPRGHHHPAGVSWQIQGNELYIPDPPDAQTFRVTYEPSGDFLPHYSSNAGQLIASAGDDLTFVLTTSPTVGVLDRRDNAYAGGILRLLPSATSKVVEERLIESSTYSSGNARWEVTIRRPFTFQTAAGSLAYEVAPMGMQPLYEAISVWGAIKLGVPSRISKEHHRQLVEQYRAALKSVGDILTNMQGRYPKFIDKRTRDHPGLREITHRGWGWWT